MHLHRLSYRIFNPETGRMMTQYTPWHPDPDFVEGCRRNIMGGRPISSITTQSIPFINEIKEELPVVRDSISAIDDVLSGLTL